MKKITDKLFSTTAAGMYMVAFAVAIAVATFIENDFGTSSAQKVIFRAWWFELLLVLFGITIIVNIFRFRMIQQKKWAVLMFHASVIIIILGAGVTRYFSYEGMMHIREGSSSNVFMLSDAFLQFEANYNGSTYQFDEKVFFATLGDNSFKKSYQIEDKVVEIEVKSFLPNPVKVLESSDSGLPILKIVVAGRGGREEYFLKDKDYENFNGTWFNFGNPEQPRAVNIYYRNDSLLVSVPSDKNQMVMATQTQDSIKLLLIYSFQMGMFKLHVQWFQFWHRHHGYIFNTCNNCNNNNAKQFKL